MARIPRVELICELLIYPVPGAENVNEWPELWNGKVA